MLSKMGDERTFFSTVKVFLPQPRINIVFFKKLKAFKDQKLSHNYY